MRKLKKISLVLLGLALAVSLGWQVAVAADSEIGRYQVILTPLSDGGLAYCLLDTVTGNLSVYAWTTNRERIIKKAYIVDFICPGK